MIDIFESTAQLRPEAVFFTAVDRRGNETAYTYRQTRLIASQLARRLRDKGVFPGDAVAVDLPNGPMYVFLALAAAYGGFALVALNHRLTDAEKLTRVLELERAGLRVAYTVDAAGEPKLFEAVCNSLLRNERAGRVDDSLGGSVEDAIHFAERAAHVFDSSHRALIMFTSGTTGKSKGVMLSADTLLFNIMQSQKLMKITDVCLSVLPYHHSYESTCGLLTMFHHGMTICINESLRSVLPNFKVYKPTEVQLVPLFVEKIYRGIWDKAEETGKAGMLRKLIKVSNAMLKVGIDMRKKLFKSVTSTFGGELLGIICGGAPLKPFLPDFFDSIGITLINGYGISECGPLVSINRPCFHDYESVGLPLPETEIRIDNPNENGEGEICVKGRNVMLGYYKNEAATAEAITDGYFHTGDIGKLGHDGFLFITGRMKNVIILQNGKNVYPEEIEDKLSAMCEYIGEIIIFASKKDENGDQTVLGAEIFPDAERAAARGISDVQEVIKKAISDYNEKEPSYKVIKNIVFRTEEFEKTTSKKIKRKYD